MFDFNDSLNDVTPVSPILFAVDMKKKEKSELLMDVFCLLSFVSPLRSSLVSVVFDFNDSLNDVTPVPPVLFPVYEKVKGKE